MAYCLFLHRIWLICILFDYQSLAYSAKLPHCCLYVCVYFDLFTQRAPQLCPSSQPSSVKRSLYAHWHFTHPNACMQTHMNITYPAGLECRTLSHCHTHTHTHITLDMEIVVRVLFPNVHLV